MMIFVVSFIIRACEWKWHWRTLNDFTVSPSMPFTHAWQPHSQTSPAAQQASFGLLKFPLRKERSGQAYRQEMQRTSQPCNKAYLEKNKKNKKTKFGFVTGSWSVPRFLTLRKPEFEFPTQNMFKNNHRNRCANVPFFLSWGLGFSTIIRNIILETKTLFSFIIRKHPLWNFVFLKVICLPGFFQPPPHFSVNHLNIYQQATWLCSYLLWK